MHATTAGLSILAIALIQFPAPANAGHERLYPEPRFEIEIDKATNTPLHLPGGVSLGGQIEIETTSEANFDLDREDHEDVLETDVRLKLKAAWASGPHLLAYGEAELSRNFIHRDPDDNDADPRFAINEAYVGFRNLEGFSATFGRREVSPDREWLFDTDLDGVDLVYRTDDVMVTAAWWRDQVIRKDMLGRHRDDRPDFLYLRGDVAIGEESRAGLWLLGRNGRRRDRDDDLLFVGVSTAGDAGRGLDYWTEAALVVGSEDGRPVRGWGFDAGAVWTDKSLPWRPHVAVGLAVGSGDDGRGTDTAFRQTGIQGNSQRFGGVVSTKTYGELVDPELSNLVVTTLGAGVRPTARTSIDVLYHEYFQARRSDEIRDSELDEDPNGKNRHLGREIDLVVGVKESEHVSVELVGGVFLPGRAFESDRTPAWFLETNIEIRF